MTLGELKKTVFKLLDEKERKDISDRLNSFFHIGQMEIATTCGFIIKETQIENNDTSEIYEMPQDFYIAQGVFMKTNNNTFVKTNDFIWQGENKIELLKNGIYRIVYKAYPQPINDITTDDFSFELPIVAQNALPFYVAAQICATDERDKYVGFLQQYQNKLLNLMEIARMKTKINMNMRGAVYGI